MPSDRKIALAGHVLSLDADTDTGLTWLDWFFGNVAPSDHTADLHIRVTAQKSSCEILDAGAIRQGPTRRWQDGAMLTVRHDIGATARVTDHELTIECPSDVNDPARAVRHLLFSGLSWWFERRDLILLHSAMIAREADAALILGATGTGKSTAAYAAQRSDWDLCSDDLVVVGLDAGRLRGFGIPKRPSLERALAESVGEGLEPLPGDSRTRVMLGADELVEGWRMLRMLIVVGHHDGDGVIEPLDHSDAMDAVLEACLESGRRAAVTRQLKTLMMLAGLPTFELLHSAEVTTRLRRTSELIRQGWDDAMNHAGDQ